MKSVMILRHAEAVPGSRDIPDIHRPLTDLGRSHAYNLGAHLKLWGLGVERIVCSTATRTRETSEALLSGGGLDASLIVAGQLYNASGEALLGYLQKLPNDIDQTMLVAHLPGVAELAALLVTEHVDLAMHYRPCTLIAVDTQETRWSDLDYGVGILKFMIPPLSSAP